MEFVIKEKQMDLLFIIVYFKFMKFLIFVDVKKLVFEKKDGRKIKIVVVIIIQ